MKQLQSILIVLGAIAAASCSTKTDEIPLAEHPRPDFERAEWVNLNGTWDFTFDASAAQAALSEGSSESFDRQILVPFPWGSPLSGVEDEGDIAWYGRKISIPESWEGKRVFLVIGASDWETEAWLDGQQLGLHQGGYIPFEFELTDYAKAGESQQLIIRADDTKSDAHLYGKQGYGNARGIWQTVYLEARGENFIKSLHFSPDVDASAVKVDYTLAEPASMKTLLTLRFKDSGQPEKIVAIAGESEGSFMLTLENQHLWSLEDPYLYELSASLKEDDRTLDEVSSYFGQRKIGVTTLPGTGYPYIALNDKPVYLQLCLDQSYHPEGYYTFPSDEFMKKEIELSKKLGLSGNRIHIKVEIPRKLYWADKLGLLIMADTPNFWGAPVPEAREDWERCMRAQLDRDFNHPSIFAWVNFNETWGLKTNKVYEKETQEWVRDMYHLTKSLDPTRLVEDNSVCEYDHVESDINSWHAYKRGVMWEPTLAEAEAKTYPGSSWNYIGVNVQNGVPMMNSECGNVWGYTGSAGDCDYTWDYHVMVNAFRRHPKICGWLYTEHHDVINEWNGYVKYDRSEKIDGLGELIPGMTVADFQSPYYVQTLCYLFTEQKAGSSVEVPLHASFMTDVNPGALTVSTQLAGWDALGEYATYGEESIPVSFVPYFVGEAGTAHVQIPEKNGLYLLRMVLKNDRGEVLHRNFTTFRVKDGSDLSDEKTLPVSFLPSSYTAEDWSVKTTSIYNGLKVNGFGNGYFEYTVDLPVTEGLKDATLIFEASAKELFGKDREGDEIKGDYMLGHGTFDHCKSPNSYAMTDNVLWPSVVEVSVDGKVIGKHELADDPADHRGILSWGSQTTERWMREGGSYGELVKMKVPVSCLKGKDKVTLRFTVPENTEGGLAIYGKDFGRYPLDPTIVLKY